MTHTQNIETPTNPTPSIPAHADVARRAARLRADALGAVALAATDQLDTECAARIEWELLADRRERLQALAGTVADAWAAYDRAEAWRRWQ